MVCVKMRCQCVVSYAGQLVIYCGARKFEFNRDTGGYTKSGYTKMGRVIIRRIIKDMHFWPGRRGDVRAKLFSFLVAQVSQSAREDVRPAVSSRCREYGNRCVLHRNEGTSFVEAGGLV